MTQNESGTIVGVECVDYACVQRLMVLGFVEGSTVKYIGSAIGGDPIEVFLEGTHVSLNRDCASHFFIKE